MIAGKKRQGCFLFLPTSQAGELLFQQQKQSGLGGFPYGQKCVSIIPQKAAFCEDGRIRVHDLPKGTCFPEDSHPSSKHTARSVTAERR